MVAFFRYSPIDILSVHLPPLKLEFNGLQQEWLRKEAAVVLTHLYSLFSASHRCILILAVSFGSD